jgi:GNAT superfamily N-acetyltransferase
LNPTAISPPFALSISRRFRRRSSRRWWIACVPQAKPRSRWWQRMINASSVTSSSAPSVEGATARGLGLAPVAVLPSHQRLGSGSLLIGTGLAHATTLGCDFVVVLGEPAYYRRFGFETASWFGLSNEYGVDEHFMALALKANGLKGLAGLVRYQPEFALVT